MANYNPVMSNVCGIGSLDNVTVQPTHELSSVRNSTATQLYSDVFKRCSAAYGSHVRPHPVTTFTVINRSNDADFYAGVYRKYAAAYNSQTDAFDAYSAMPESVVQVTSANVVLHNGISDANVISPPQPYNLSSLSIPAGVNNGVAQPSLSVRPCSPVVTCGRELAVVRSNPLLLQVPLLRDLKYTNCLPTQPYMHPLQRFSL